MMRWEGWIVATAITYIVLDSGSCGKMLVLFAKLRLRLTTERGTPFMPFFLALIQFWIHEEVYKHLFGASHFLHCLLNGRSWLFFCGVWKSYRLAFVLLASREYSCISFQLLVFLFFLSSFLFSALRPEDDIFITRFWFWMQSFILKARTSLSYRSVGSRLVIVCCKIEQPNYIKELPMFSPRYFLYLGFFPSLS